MHNNTEQLPENIVGGMGDLAEAAKNLGKALTQAVPVHTGPNRKKRRRKKALAKNRKGGRGYTKPIFKRVKRKRG